MNYGSLVELVGAMECFDLPLLVQACDESRGAIRVQLSRWMKQGKVVGLRRGMYTLPAAFRRAPLSVARLANLICSPSYLSGPWALGYYDLIPERVVHLTSVTTRMPRRFENPFGVFVYQNIKREAFFGYEAVRYGGQDTLVAQPEKALLDHWHLVPGEWTPARLEEMRYQNTDRVDGERLGEYARRFASPRLDRAVRRWLDVAADEKKGTTLL